MISHNNKTVFIHIPKTGGTSIEQLIWPIELGREESDLWMGFVDGFHNKYQTGGLQHLFASQIRQELGGELFDDYFKFCIVRNPWSKAVSQFKYMSGRADLRGFIGMEEGAEFKQYLSLIQAKEHVQWAPQFKFVFDRNGGKLVDHIGFFENFESEVRYVAGLLGLAIDDVPHLNRADGSMDVLYDDESHEMVAHMYAQDIKCFGY